MKRNFRTSVITARALTDPDPSFASLVKGGANQRPFRAVKSDVRLLSETSTHTEKESVMTDKTIAPEGHDIAALKFSKTEFATEDAVKAWLDEGGYSDYTITETAKSFDVDNTASNFEEGSIEKIEGVTKGIDCFVGKLSEEQPVEKSQDEKTADKVKANTSDVTPVGSTKSEGDEVDVDPAADPAADPATTEEADAEEDVAKMVSDFETVMKGTYETSVLTYILSEMAYLVMDADYMGTDAAVVDDVKAAAKTLIVALTSAQSDVIVKFEEVFRKHLAERGFDLADMAGLTTEATKVEDAPATPATKTAETSEGESGEQKVEKTETPVMGDAGLAAALKSLTDAVTGIATGVTKVTEKVDGLTGRVEAVEQTTQSRKGADVSDEDTEAPTSATQKSDDQIAEARKLRKQRLASAMGHPRSSHV